MSNGDSSMTRNVALKMLLSAQFPLKSARAGSQDHLATYLANTHAKGHHAALLQGDCHPHRNNEERKKKENPGFSFSPR